MNMLIIQSQRASLHGVRDVAVQHADAADPGVVGDPHGAVGVVGRGRHLLQKKPAKNQTKKHIKLIGVIKVQLF